MLKLSLPLLILLALAIFGKDVSAQSCCSGGVPLSGNIGMPISEEGNWQFSLNYDLNVLNTLKDGTNTLSDNTRKRTTHSIMTQAGYTLNDRFSVETFFSFVRQERKITPIGQPATFTATDGIGDAVLLLKYQFLKNFQVGAGFKAPLGPSDLSNEIGIPLNADLQPGSGAWDILYWIGGRQTIKSRPSMTAIGSAIFRSTGQNKKYFGNQVYEFGDELQINLGIADRITLGSLIFDPSLSFKYRHVAADKNKADNTSDIKPVPSTGGEWVFIRPAISYLLSPATSFQANVQLPLYAKLVNTQVTPTYRINVGATFLIKNKKSYEID
ncbi:MAG: hypothetical protein RIG77_23650 [Cyclobacteriaceae bacterium]